jgi:hypothetical protein
MLRKGLSIRTIPLMIHPMRGNLMAGITDEINDVGVFQGSLTKDEKRCPNITVIKKRDHILGVIDDISLGIGSLIIVINDLFDIKPVRMKPFFNINRHRHIGLMVQYEKLPEIKKYYK